MDSGTGPGPDHLFPRFHVRPPRGYLNDPNGPVVVDGLVHLYYQYRYTLDLESPVLWGHATSPDLVRWEYHRPAIGPHPLAGDRDGCWSGNTVVDPAGGVRAFYSGRVAGQRLQETLSAVSFDRGHSFGPPHPLVPDPGVEEQIVELRDPFVWRDDDRWRMALGAGTTSGTAMIRLYTSTDLEDWPYAGKLAWMPRTRTATWDSGVMWECPQIVLHPRGPVAVVGSYAPLDGVMNALSFAVPTGTDREVAATSLHLVDHGPNFYAASVLNDPDGGAVVWGWATEGRAPQWCAEAGWSGVITLPRRVDVRPDGSLASSPVRALATLRTEPAGREVRGRLDGLGAQLEFLVEHEAERLGAYAVRLGFGPDEFLEIVVDPTAAEVRVDRDRASRDPRAHGGVFTVPGLRELSDRGSQIRGFVDGSILELFLPGGRVATVRCYPTGSPPWSVQVSGAPSGVRTWVWSLASEGAGPAV